jgi:uncharacterized protein
VAEALGQPRRERERLLGLAREYVERLSRRLPLVAAAVVGSVARGDFNVWSDVDVLVVAEGLPERTPDRGSLLVADAPGGVQPVGSPPKSSSGLDEAERPGSGGGGTRRCPRR